MRFRHWRTGLIPHDPMALATAPRISDKAFATAPPPARLDRSHIDPAPQLFGNSDAGDCTCAGIYNSILAVAAINKYRLDIPDSKAIDLYAAMTGYPDTDPGARELDVLSYVARYGLDVGQQTPLALQYGAIDPSSRARLAQIAAALGVTYLGVKLSLSDEGTPGTWDTNPPADAGDPTPGSAGDHCLLLWDYTGLGDGDTARLITWGGFQRVTWRWLAQRVTESHGLLWRQLLPENAPYARMLNELFG